MFVNRAGTLLVGVLACAVSTSSFVAAPARAAGEPVASVAPDANLPIDLEAASSRFDGRERKLTFENVRIRQGTMSVTARYGEAERLDFENSRWRFNGDVVLENQGARVECADAELQFSGHALRSAVLRGEPVRLEQRRESAAEPTKGSARVMEYDVVAGTIRLSGEAWLSDGANEVSGERIAYDLRREYVTADSGGGGQVRMKIQPPPRKAPDEAAP